MKFHGQTDYDHDGKLPKTGVIVTNLGTPDAPEASALRRYLREFLSDPRVVEVPRLIWWFILNLIIVPLRSGSSAKNYKTVWTDAGSPLLDITLRQADALQAKVDEKHGKGKIKVAAAMRYGNPSIKSVLDDFAKNNIRHVVALPLYPQYSGATTATVVDKAADCLRTMRWQPALRTLPPYHDDPAYIDALASDLSKQLDALDFEPEVLLLSFHGMPERTLHLGDPYHCHCQKTSRLLQGKLHRPGLKFRTTFQSRFGRAKWLEPATDTVLAEEAKAGTKRLAIAAPGFSADCLETLEELAIQGREQFTEAGGEHFASLSCLNVSDPGLAMLETLLRRELSGWISA